MASPRFLLRDGGRLTYETTMVERGGQVEFQFSPTIENALGRDAHGKVLGDALGTLLVERKWLIEEMLDDRYNKVLYAQQRGIHLDPQEVFPDRLRNALYSSFNYTNFPDLRNRYIIPLTQDAQVPRMTKEAQREFLRELLFEATLLVQNDLLIDLLDQDDARASKNPQAPFLENELEKVCNRGKALPASVGPPPQSGLQFTAHGLDQLNAERRLRNDTAREILELVSGVMASSNALLLMPIHNTVPVLQFRNRELFKRINRLNEKRRHAGRETNLAKALVALALDDLWAQGKFNYASLVRLNPISPLLCQRWDQIALEDVRDGALDSMADALRLAVRENLNLNAEMLVYWSRLSSQGSVRRAREVWEDLLNHTHETSSKEGARLEEEPRNPDVMLKRFVDLGRYFNTPEMQTRLNADYPMDPVRRRNIAETLAVVAFEKREQDEAKKKRVDFLNFGVALAGGAGIALKSWPFLVMVMSADALVTATEALPLYARMDAAAKLTETLFLQLYKTASLNVNSKEYFDQIFVERDIFVQAATSLALVGLNFAGAAVWSAPPVLRFLRIVKPAADARYVGLEIKSMEDLNRDFGAWLRLMREEFPEVVDDLLEYGRTQTALGHPDLKDVVSTGLKTRMPSSRIQALVRGETQLEKATSARSALREYELQIILYEEDLKNQIDVAERALKSPMNKARRPEINQEIERLDKDIKHLRNLKKSYGVAESFLQQQFKFDHHAFWTSKLAEKTFRGTIGLGGRIPGAPRAYAAILRFFQNFKTPRFVSVPWQAVKDTPAGQRFANFLKGMDAPVRGYFKEVGSPASDQVWRFDPYTPFDDLPEAIRKEWLATYPKELPFRTRFAHATRRTLLGKTVWTKGDGRLLPNWMYEKIAPTLGRRLDRFIRRNWDEDFYSWMMKRSNGRFDVDRETISKFVNQGLVIGPPANLIGDRYWRGKLQQNEDGDFWKGAKRREWDETAINILGGIPTVGFQTAIGIANMTYLRKMSYTLPASFVTQGIVSFVVQGIKLREKIFSWDCLQAITHRMNTNAVYNASVSQMATEFFWGFRDGLENVIGVTPKTTSLIFVISVLDKGGRSALFNWASKKPFGWNIDAQGSCKEEAKLFGDIMIEDPNDPRTLAHAMAEAAGFRWPASVDEINRLVPPELKSHLSAGPSSDNPLEGMGGDEGAHGPASFPVDGDSVEPSRFGDRAAVRQLPPGSLPDDAEPATGAFRAGSRRPLRIRLPDDDIEIARRSHTGTGGRLSPPYFTGSAPPLARSGLSGGMGSYAAP
ncbi:MAG: hypothetical protein V1798_09185 [Pseudomonadota bacterium]